MATSQKLCKFCSLSVAKYTCPRCGEGYCSSACYKDTKHLHCSENFYKEMVMAELSGKQCSAEQKAKMLRTLQKLEAEERGERELHHQMNDNDDEYDGAGQVDEDDDDILERFGDLDVENDDPPAEEIWKRLSEKERREFTQLYESGDAAKLVPVWEPWWRHKEKLVEEIGGATDKSSSSKCPPFPKASKTVSKADHSHSESESSIACDIISFLYAYAFTMKLYNGDYRDFLVECAAQMMDISGSLGLSHHYDSAEFAIVSAINRIQSVNDATDYGSAPVEAIKEVMSIVEGPSVAEKSLRYCVCALADFRQLCRSAKNESRDKSFLTRLESVEKMLSFHINWLGEHYKEFVGIYPELQSFYERRTRRDESFRAEADRMDATVKSHRAQLSDAPKIQELN